MPLAVTHIIVPIIFLELLRDHSRRISKFFSKRYTFLIGIAGLFPDLDLHLITFLGYLGETIPTAKIDLGHRIIFHNIWAPLGFLIFFSFFYYAAPKLKSKLKKSKVTKKSRTKFERFGKVFLILFLGWSIHLILDAVFTGKVMPFYPLNDYLLDYNLVGQVAEMAGILKITILVSMDALLLFFWLWHEEVHHYIKDYF